MKLDDIMKELIQRLEDLELLTTDAQLYKADEIWDRLLVLILELEEQNRKSTDVLQRLQSIGLEDITAKYLEYNRPSLQAIKTCTELFDCGRWSEEYKFDIKPMVEIIVHESDQQVLRLSIDLFSTVCSEIDDGNFGIVLSRLVSRLESSNGLVAVGFIRNLQTMYRSIYPHDRVKAVECGIIPALVNTLRSVDQEVIYESIAAIENFCKHADCEVISAELMRLDLIQTLNDLCIKYSNDFALKIRMIWIAGTIASGMRDFPVSLVRSLIFEQLTISMCDVDMNDPLRLLIMSAT
ncbi:hypothetical protein BATDEDRAFT_22394 [Batrachochytrium dendrobatidis JAM81]|uniref:Uncharacterized protein n=1 Tax=Batrachochytrium dendrobatidis (strain JAM81 / FGSC 10211) TaxID=684364 RepID=F4NU72_BATDJ|nr:uncharacterized protein BATDEDRAFT_22394 [Batrachochytrium dendrobatidis JAM81]EGF83580.1 hypothetical protein BATDEDRAFT_22394 [Batrachochytrium dendrobatidis JAM81]|eukprot:XP_006675557.1 hypothetical protein BATDEDRAFT_22394 [Batrachochytrium dendrobatidis JAM81]